MLRPTAGNVFRFVVPDGRVVFVRVLEECGHWGAVLVGHDRAGDRVELRVRTDRISQTAVLADALRLAVETWVEEGR